MDPAKFFINSEHPVLWLKSCPYVGLLAPWHSPENFSILATKIDHRGKFFQHGVIADMIDDNEFIRAYTVDLAIPAVLVMFLPEELQDISFESAVLDTFEKVIEGFECFLDLHDHLRPLPAIQKRS